MKYGIFVLAALLLAGCSAIPEPIATDDEQTLVSYQAAANNSGQVIGEQARWGGVIADVRNGEEYTVIEVVNFPLKSWGRPLVSDDSNGRFLALVDGFVDPEVYKQGRSLTVLGTLEETQTGKIDDYTYTYPVLKAEGYYLWEKQKERINTEINYAPLWFRHNFYAPFPYHPYRYPVRVIKSDDNSGTPDKDRQ
ncbi:Slp family lipoprotein [Idiomarina seosinensis]|uniref:Starvation-inducible protein n=1 Tax=Idiomarina seosinensis TaxID=281739 RepID=A0A432ZJD8_9GAMM|nr:Slp family lipoprotein [Idiomarina seosinensis]RUO78033.1 starvation-inducible protein [Idiomarina seosinensis]